MSVSLWGCIGHVPQCTCGGQRTAFRDQFPPYSLWGQVTERRSSGLATGAFNHRHHHHPRPSHALAVSGRIRHLTYLPATLIASHHSMPPLCLVLPFYSQDFHMVKLNAPFLYSGPPFRLAFPFPLKTLSQHSRLGKSWVFNLSS